MTRAAGALAALALAGCAATLDTAATSTWSSPHAITSETLYRNLVGAMRQCYTVPSIKVEADYFPEAKAGSLRLLWGNSVGVIEWLRIEVAPDGTGSTLRATHRTAQDRFPDAIAGWARGDASSCPYR